MNSTALVPFNGQALLPLWESRPHLLVDQEMVAIKSTVRGICIEGALSILEVFGYQGTTFHYMSNRWSIDDLVNEEYFPECLGRMANETPVVWFWGGPPNKLKWYQGTLQTLLEDRILCELIARGTKEVAKWIGLDLTTVTQ